MVSFSLVLVIFAIILSVLGIILAGIRSISYGKHDMKKMLFICTPFVLFLLLYAIIGDATSAGLIVMLACIIVMIVLLLFLGVRRLINI